ncbi:aminotransferase class I/II-fold pyridoxal phosphate-dependent enzyme [Fictibacillus nanhaiensis]|uniref:aminotransferase class I/II-fold pyridoxal phosphate-dependent enzyme n=1 Tax=Fictibacillus nanhaiensis TaxID=742169 RepID=UPI002E242BBC|nr:aminotransferase class I/II-fold pyridoxal phosphate-dependent enzyme [Fictibacillus nanhaiensis]MED1863919.1 aminotransferase class I/II-fold pyridoxal phosphate-dependent enzyme [Fictibacillus nanhaiensis]
MPILTNKKRIFLCAPHMSGNEQKYMNEAFQTNWIAPLGPNVDAFEKEIAAHVGARAGVAVSSGTAAIHLALTLLGVSRGDTVFCSSLTFVASANPILYQGAEPVFIDSEPDTWNMSPHALQKALQAAAEKGKLPKAVIVVNLYGQSAKMDEIVALCNQYEVPLVEDAAESLGSHYKGKASGTFGRFGIYSFNGNKIITTSGGGMLVSQDDAAIETGRFLSAQAKDQAIHYEHSVMGFNYRMSNILAGIGRGQLEVLHQRIHQKRAIYDLYQQKLSDLPGVHFNPELAETFSNRWLSVLTLNPAETTVSVLQVIEALAAENIEARPVWKPLHLQPLFKDASYFSHEPHKSVSEQLFENGICLPSGTSMTEEEQLRVIGTIRDLLTVSRPALISGSRTYQT